MFRKAEVTIGFGARDVSQTQIEMKRWTEEEHVKNKMRVMYRAVSFLNPYRPVRKQPSYLQFSVSKVVYPISKSPQSNRLKQNERCS